MSRRKAGRVPRRIDPEPDDDMEMPDLVIDVKPDRNLGSLAQEPWSARDMPMSGLFGVERPLQTASRPLGAPNTCAPWMPLSSSGESLAFAPACIRTFEWVPLPWGWPRDRPGLPSPRLRPTGFPSPPWRPHPESGSTPPLTHPLPPSRPPPLDRQAPRSVDLRPLREDLPIRVHRRFHGSQKTRLSAPPSPQPHLR